MYTWERPRQAEQLAKMAEAPTLSIISADDKGGCWGWGGSQLQEVTRNGSKIIMQI